ncbi:hypothetical protein EUTSA_v10023614mg [Eutrema salsugineum]|uniref:Uncharacterized protein n=1 Tax=Eutrema salsugineum TaxID=72664 RepID=V4KQC4_EUTSA|nr:uncharacterized protein LOC18010123 [Eutrema salsugineum]ESQ29533.1 hypothetical protein EUTSA_v10023614mg [Eutrema salsugineum]
MEFFQKAKAVRLKSHHDKYLIADEDEESVAQERNGSAGAAKWTVELVPGSTNLIRLKSAYGKYLTASNKPFLLGATGRKVLQSNPSRLDSSLAWEPIRDAALVKLKTRYGHYLRGNGGLPPWRNSVTHDIPHRSATQDWILWHVDVVEILTDQQHHQQQQQQQPPSPLHHSDSLDFEPGSPSCRSNRFFRQESTDSVAVGSPPKSEGRVIYYHMADDDGEVEDDSVEVNSFTFKGNGVEELTKRLKEESNVEDVIVCTRSPLNGKLFPLRLQLPPNNADMTVVLVPTSSKIAEEFIK